METTERVLTAPEVAALMRVSRITVIRWIEAGHLAAFRASPLGHYRITPAEVRRFMASGNHGNAA